MENVFDVKFKSIGNELGKLTPIEAEIDIPFAIKRIYYIYNVKDGERRGFHSHQDLKQILICVHGSVEIKCKTPNEEIIYKLDQPNNGLYIGEMIWREMFNFTQDAVLLVLASKHYDDNDYIKNYDEYTKLAKIYFGGQQ